MTPTGQDLVHLLLGHTGGPYGYGSKWNVRDPNPKGPVDCSGFIRWGVVQEGLPFPDGSWNQLAFCRAHNLIIPVKQAIETAGALLFVGRQGEDHIAASQGNRLTVEARGHVYGVGVWTADVPPRAWTWGALIPGFDYSGVHAPFTPPGPQPAPSQEDSDLVANLPTIQRGATGQLVKNLQGLLLAANRGPAGLVGPDGHPDGDFGPGTEAALINWQTEARVPGSIDGNGRGDGICGTNTWRWLLGIHP